MMCKIQRISTERKLERNARRYERLRQEAEGYVDQGFGTKPRLFFKGNLYGLVKSYPR